VATADAFCRNSAGFACRGSVHLTLRLNSNAPAIPQTDARTLHPPHLSASVAAYRSNKPMQIGSGAIHFNRGRKDQFWR
jgi:hypothetical protein